MNPNYPLRQWAIVAEYKGVAIVECKGDVPKSFLGQSYGTDGHTYLWRKIVSGEGRACLDSLAFPSERLAKKFLDGVSDTSELYSWEEAWEVLLRNDDTGRAKAIYDEQVAVRKKATYQWIERLGHFMLIPTITDGQWRTRMM